MSSSRFSAAALAAVATLLVGAAPARACPDAAKQAMNASEAPQAAYTPAPARKALVQPALACDAKCQAAHGQKAKKAQGEAALLRSSSTGV